jgi:hypothetical protein
MPGFIDETLHAECCAKDWKWHSNSKFLESFIL